MNNFRGANFNEFYSFTALQKRTSFCGFTCMINEQIPCFIVRLECRFLGEKTHEIHEN